jgi:hypothetical protein
MKLSSIVSNSVHRAKGANRMVTPFLTVFVLVVSLVPMTWFAPSITQHTVAESQLPASVAPSGSTRIAPASRGIPLIFIENVGQFDKRVHFQARSGNTMLFLTDDALWVSLTELSSKPDPISEMETPDAVDTETGTVRGINLKLSFVGANPHPRLEPFNKLDTQISFFTGSDPGQWHTHLPAWGGVRYVDLYPGADLEITSQNGQLAPRLVVREHPSLQNVRLRVEGADDLALEDDILRLATRLGNVALPLLAVEGAAPKVEPAISVVDEAYQVFAPFASMSPPAINATLTSIPTLLYSTYLGGSGDDMADDITVDSADNVYITGQTSSANFLTTPGVYDTSYNGNPVDVFVSKLSADGSTLLYSTYLGGSDVDAGNGIAVDSAGNVYITGATYSTDFPATPTALDTTLNGGRDAFVAKLNATGDVLIYGTYLGGSLWEYGLDIAVDDADDAYVTGFTHGGFPTTPGVVQRIHSGSCDAFVTKLNADGSALVYSTYLGGSSLDHGENIALDGEGNAYVTGDAYSIDFPTANPVQPTKAGGGDAFVTKLNADGSALVYSTYLGGSGIDREIGRDITVDSAGNVYVTGSTDSIDFPTVSPLQPTYGGGASDVFVAKLSASGSVLVYSTYLGGSGTDERTDIAIDSAGNAYVTGVTTSTDFPTANPLQATKNGGGDAFVAKLNTDGSALLYSSYLGGSGDENPLSPSTIGGIAVDSGGNIVLAGTTGSTDFPATPGAYDISYNGGNYDVFVTKLRLGGSPPSLFYSTYLGGRGEDRAYDIALDSAGNVYVTGETASTDFPTTPGAYDRFYSGDPIDVFVTKLSADGSTLLYSTYLGGDGEDAGNGITVDSAGNVYITGKTYSTDFPATPGALDTTLSGGRDAFVTKLNAAGDGLVYSTYLGGSSWDYGSCIVIDDTGSAYVGGFTHGSFPITSGAAQTTFGGSGDGFAAKLSSDGSTLLYSTYLGGYSWEGIAEIAVDETGNTYLASHTHSTDFPTTPGAWDRTCDNCQTNVSTDGAVAKLNADGSEFVYSTLIGGADASGGEEFRDIAIDSAGNAYLTGNTSSADFPTTTNALQPGFGGGGNDAVVVKLNADGSDLLYSTYLGGSGADRGYGIAIDGDGNAYVTGYTASTDFATVDPLQAANAGGYDAFVTKVNDDGSALLYSSYLGGSGDENCSDPPHGHARIALDRRRNIYLTGFTGSTDFPTTDAYDVSFNGGPYDAFVTSLHLVPVAEERIFLPLILKQ